ncbi:MAG: glycosyltransferase family 39 protein [Acidimicrobiales bacterium]|nr:glycosyltransferase family 39 protein [Acidimicrobiales bacterium]
MTSFVGSKTGRIRQWGRASVATPWRRSVWRGGVAYLVSRVMVVAGAGIVAAQRGVGDSVAGMPRPSTATRYIADVLTNWDGKWYLEIVRNGYPTHIPPNITYEQTEARAAFFPGYPLTVRAADWILPGGDVFASLAVNVVLGALAVYLVGMLARDLFDAEIAGRAMVLFAMFPGSFVLSLAYSEALLLVLAAGALLALHRRHWWLAGVLSALGTATRPNGVALVAACGVAAVLAIKDRREWRSLVAPILAPLGFLGYQYYLYVHTDEDLAWFRVQREAWREGTSFGATAVRGTLDFLTNPLESPTDLLTAISVITMCALLWTTWKRRLPLPILAYIAVVLALMLIPETVTARPRFLYTAFPLLISAAAWWPTRDRDGWAATMAMCGAGLVTLSGLYGVFGAIP